MGRKRKQRRQPHGSAWHWKQTDCWYYTLPGTKKRMPLFDEAGERIRGKENREAAERALARERLSLEGEAVGGTAGHGPWLVARVCSEYIQYCERGLVKGTISKGHRDNAVSWLNDLCRYCGALPVGQLKKGQIKAWLESHTTWRSSATHRGVIAIVLAAFNRAEELYNVSNPLKGMKKPPSKPRLHSFGEKDEKALYGATEPCFGDFLLTLIHTGLRPFCELARITADDVEETDRGMMWRVDSSKNKKTRKIPVRPEVAELTRKLMKTVPRGSRIPLFRNTKGRPWKRMTGVVRFLTIKEKLGWDKDPVKTHYSCYTCRHTFAHRMLSGYWTGGVGCSIETLAELMGDTPKVAFDHYGKEWGQHYQAPLWAAIGEGSEGPGRPVQGQGKSQEATASGSKDRPSSDRSGSNRKSVGRRARPGGVGGLHDDPNVPHRQREGSGDMKAKMGKRRRPRGSAWHWKQTDCWYYTPPGTTRRVPLVDEDGRRVRGPENRKAAELALARVKLAGQWRPTAEPAGEGEWVVAQVCSEFIQSCERRLARGAVSQGYRDEVVRYLNELCSYCGALPVAQLRRGHVKHWIEIHETWRSPATQRNAIAIVLAAFNHAQEMHNVGNPLKGLKKPPARPRLHSFSEEDEEAIYGATDEPFGNFVFAAIRTGLRPFCELARMTADEVVETERGMMWRVYSSKTKKPRKIPVRSEVAELTRELMTTAPPGSGIPLFCNSQGRPWKKGTGVGRFRRLKRKLGWDNDPVKKRYSCYTCRHTFAHRMLSGYWNGGVGCSIETLAELMGDTPKVAFDHYGKQWGQHYQEPLWIAIGIGPKSPAT